MAKIKWSDPFVWFFFAVEVVFIILYGTVVDYETTTAGGACNPLDSSAAQPADCSVAQYYPMFQDVHVMIFIGFGFLMTFLRKYGFSSVGMNFMVAALAIQWGILVTSFFEQVVAGHTLHKINLTIQSLIVGDFAAGAVLISFGAVLGKVTPVQLLAMCLMELVFYAINEAIIVTNIKAVDMGGSILVHSFGAYFGLAVSRVITNKEKAKDNPDNSSVYHSDMFAMIGTIFLWMYWPSFNGALAAGLTGSQHRVVINTVLALTASCMSAFLASRLFRGGEFDMVDIQNATLAGGVAVGSSSDLVIGPMGAMIIGLIAGVLSVWGYVKLQPWLEEKLGLHDTCGVHNLHGMPGVMGAIGGSISAAAAGTAAYGSDLGLIFPAIGEDGRTTSEQGAMQIVALICTLGFSIIGGLITGAVLKYTTQEPEHYFTDHKAWEVPSEEIPFFHAGQHGKDYAQPMDQLSPSAQDTKSVVVDVPADGDAVSDAAG